MGLLGYAYLVPGVWYASYEYHCPLFFVFGSIAWQEPLPPHALYPSVAVLLYHGRAMAAFSIQGGGVGGWGVLIFLIAIVI